MEYSNGLWTCFTAHFMAYFKKTTTKEQKKKTWVFIHGLPTFRIALEQPKDVLTALQSKS